jgi:hypothetical protein
MGVEGLEDVKGVSLHAERAAECEQFEGEKCELREDTCYGPSSSVHPVEWT